MSTGTLRYSCFTVTDSNPCLGLRLRHLVAMGNGGDREVEQDSGSLESHSPPETWRTDASSRPVDPKGDEGKSLPGVTSVCRLQPQGQLRPNVPGNEARP